VDHRQAVDEHRDVVAVGVRRPADRVDLILIDHLQPVVVAFALSSRYTFLLVPSSRRNTWTWSAWMRAVLSTIPSSTPGDPLGEEPMPLGVGESDPVQRLQLQPQVRGQICLRPDWQVLVRLLLQLPDERRFEFGLGLVRRGRDPVRNELGDDGALGTDRDQVERPGVPAQPRVGLCTGMTVTTSSSPT